MVTAVILQDRSPTSTATSVPFIGAGLVVQPLYDQVHQWQTKCIRSRNSSYRRLVGSRAVSITCSQFGTQCVPNWNYLRPHPEPALILLDLTIPIINGPTFLQQLHSGSGPTRGKIPIEETCFPSLLSHYFACRRHFSSVSLPVSAVSWQASPCWSLQLECVTETRRPAMAN